MNIPTAINISTNTRTTAINQDALFDEIRMGRERGGGREGEEEREGGQGREGGEGRERRRGREGERRDDIPYR